MDNDIQTAFIFQRNLQTNLNTCPTVSQVPGNLRHKILIVAVGTTRTLLFPPHHRQESVPTERCCFRGLLDVTSNVHRTWAAFLCGYPLLSYRLPTKTAQRHAVLSWYTYSGAPPSCNGYSVFTTMRIPIVARHNKTR